MFYCNDFTYLDGLLFMCLHYQRLKQENPNDPDLKDALACIQDCERRQMELTVNG